MSKGIILEISGDEAIVLTKEGEFKKINISNRQHCKVGEELSIPHMQLVAKGEPPKKGIFTSMALIASFLLVIVSVLIFIPSWQEEEAFAYVSLDINPSVEIGVNESFQVMTITGWNEEGIKLVEQLDDYSGQSLDEVTYHIIMAARASGYIEGNHDILLSTTFMDTVAEPEYDQFLEDIFDQLEQKILATQGSADLTAQGGNSNPPAVSPEDNSTIQLVHETGENIVIHRLYTTKEDRETAKKHGLSPVKYMIYLAALEQGMEIDIDDIKGSSISELAQQLSDVEVALGNSFFDNIQNKGQALPNRTEEDSLNEAPATEKSDSETEGDIASPEDSDKHDQQGKDRHQDGKHKNDKGNDRRDKDDRDKDSKKDKGNKDKDNKDKDKEDKDKKNSGREFAGQDEDGKNLGRDKDIDITNTPPGQRSSDLDIKGNQNPSQSGQNDRQSWNNGKQQGQVDQQQIQLERRSTNAEKDNDEDRDKKNKDKDKDDKDKDDKNKDKKDGKELDSDKDKEKSWDRSQDKDRD